MGGRYWRFCLALLLCISPFLSGCFFAFYPESFDGSNFEEFQWHLETNPPCLESPSTIYPPLCEATITRESNGEYVVLLGVRPDFQSDSPFVPQRALTDAEVDRMLAFFSGLRINRQPRPFCVIPRLGDFIGEAIFRWDDLKLVMEDCDRPRLDFKQSKAIMLFLDELVKTD